MVKLITKKVNINTKDVKTRLDDVVRSYDLDDTKIEIKVINSNVDLTDAKIHCVFKYFVNGKRYAIEKIYTDTTKDSFYIQFPEELKGIAGRVYIGVYADLGEQRIDIKDMEIYLDNSIIDQDIDFVAINYFESFENVISEYKDKSTIEINEIKKLKNDAEESHDIAIDRINEYIIDTKKLSEKVMEEIDETSKAIESAKESFESDVNDFENIKEVAKNTASNAVSEIEEAKDNALEKMAENENYVTAKYESLVNLFEDSSDKVKGFNESFEKNLEKAGVTITVAEDFKKRIDTLEIKSNETVGLKEKIDELEKRPVPQPYDDKPIIKRIETLEQKDDKDTVYNNTEIKEEVKNAKSKLDELSEKVASLETRTDNDTVYDDTGVKQSISSVDTKVDKLSAKVTELEQKPSSEAYDDTELSNRVTALERKEDKGAVYDDTEIKKELSELNQSIAKKKLYYAYAYEKDGANGFTKADVYDSFYREISNYLGISEKDSDNPDDYFWMPARVASDDELSKALFEVNKLKDLHRKAPTGYALDRTTIPWTVRFDNGCELRFPKNSPTSERDKANLIYGYGFPANNNSTVAFSAPIPPLIISASRGAFTVDKFKESDEAHFHVTYADYRLYYPIRKSDDFNWENAYGDRVNQTVSTNGKTNFAKLMYELGIWSEEDVLYLGATKK